MSFDIKQPGEALRRAREERGLSLEHVAAATKIRKSYLESIEDGSLAGLPHPYYARNFARVYAAFLGLDSDEIAAQYPGTQAPKVPKSLKVVPTSSDPWGYVLGLVVLVSLISLGVYAYSRLTPTGALQSIPPLLQAGPVPTDTPTLTATAIPTGTPTPSYADVAHVEVHIVAPTWLYVLVDNKTESEFSATLEPGATRSWTGKESVYMIAGNAGGVDVTYNGHDTGPLGKKGEVVRMIWTPSEGAQTPTPAPATSTPTITPRPVTPRPPTPRPATPTRTVRAAVEEHTSTPVPPRPTPRPQPTATATPKRNG